MPPSVLPVLIAFPLLDASAFSSFPRVIWNFISKGLHYHFPGAQELVKNSINSQCQGFSSHQTISPVHHPPRPSYSVPSSRQEGILAVSVQKVGLFLNSYMENTKRLQSEQEHTMVVFKQRNPQISQKSWSQKPWKQEGSPAALRASISLYAVSNAHPKPHSISMEESPLPTSLLPQFIPMGAGHNGIFQPIHQAHEGSRLHIHRELTREAEIKSGEDTYVHRVPFFHFMGNQLTQTTILLSNMKQSYYFTIFLLGEVSYDYLEYSVKVEIGAISWSW